MAGHSHSANIKYRKDRQDQARSQLFLKLRKKITTLIETEGRVTEKVLTLARENQFPKEKISQIWEKFRTEKERKVPRQVLYQAPFGIIIYCEKSENIPNNLENKLKLKKLPLTLLPSYFRLSHSFKVSGKKSQESWEEFLLSALPSDIWEKVNYNEPESEFNSADKEAIERLKNIITENNLELVIEEEKTFWQSLISFQLTKKEELSYYSEAEKRLINIKYYANVEK